MARDIPNLSLRRQDRLPGPRSGPAIAESRYGRCDGPGILARRLALLQTVNPILWWCLRPL